MVKIILSLIFVLLTSPLYGQVIKHKTEAGDNWSYVSTAKNTSDGSDNTITTSSSLTVNAGGYISCAASGGAAITGLTCGGSNTLGNGIDTVDTTDSWYFYEKSKANAASYTGTCTATYASATTYRTISCVSYDGAATSSSEDGHTCTHPGCDYKATASTTIEIDDSVGIPVTTTNANDFFIVHVLAWDSAPDWTQTSPYTLRGTDNSMNIVFDARVSSTGEYPAGAIATQNTTQSYMMIFKAVKED
jgi:hypothetical protein